MEKKYKSYVMPDILPAYIKLEKWFTQTNLMTIDGMNVATAYTFLLTDKKQ